jgi:hypothetical protein
MAAAMKRAGFETLPDLQKWRWELTEPDLIGQPRHFYLCVPHWLPIALCAAFAAAPWINWRFCLRTFLLAIALISLFIGLLVIVN